MYSRLEFHLHVFLFRRVRLEEIIFFEIHHAGKNICREDLNFGVEVAHVAVIEAAGGLNFIFSVANFAL